MSRCEAVAALIPWYANGTLAGEQRSEVQRHLEGCADCRALAEQDRALVGAAGVTLPADALEHVHPRLLVRYEGDPGSFDAETLQGIERRLAGCVHCREALERLREVSRSLAVPPQAEPAASLVARIWDMLASSVLRPAPALAYLLLLLVAIPALRVLDSGGTSGPATPLSSPRTIEVRGDRAVRAAQGGALVPPLEIRVDPQHPDLLLRLATELSGQDLAAPFDLALARDGVEVWSDRRGREDFVVDESGVSLLLVLRPQQLEPGAYELSLRALRPGDPLDGQALFRRSIVIVSP